MDEQVIKITADQHSTLVAKLRCDIDDAEEYYQSEIEPRIMIANDVYNASESMYKKMFPKLAKRSSIVSSDVADTIEWALPSLIKIFFGGEQIISIQGENVEDDERAQKMEQLIGYQLERKNKAFNLFYAWIKDALITNLGILKCYWCREFEDEQKQEFMSEEMLVQLSASPDIKVDDVAFDWAQGLYSVTYTAPKMIKNQPVMENIIASEFRYSPYARTLENADFVAHKKAVSIDWLRKEVKAGRFDKKRTEQAIEDAREPVYETLDEQNRDWYEPNRQTAIEKGRQRTDLYECYTKTNLDNDQNGLLDDYIITVCNNQILRVEKNTFGRHPFFVLSPTIDPHKIWVDKGFADIIAQLQHLKTALIRQIVGNVAISNEPQLAVSLDNVVDINDVIEAKQLIRLQGINSGGKVSDILAPIQRPQLQSWTFNLLEYIDQTRESRTGITRYQQGLSPDTLNKTATGISLITQASSQRLELIARMFLESGISPLYRFLIDLNQRFIDEETTIRLLNEPLQIMPDDLKGDFDLIVSSGLGMGTKQDKQAQAQMIIQIVEKLVAVGMAGPEQIYNAAKKVLESIGEKDVDAFVMNPQQMQQQQAMQAQQASMMPGVPPQGMPGAIPPPQGGVV